MTMLATSVKKETKGPKKRQVSIHLFMDDIVTATENMVQTKHLLSKLVGKLEWTELYLKPEKFRSLVIKKGRVSQMTPSIGGNPITSITEKPIKYLGKLQKSIECPGTSRGGAEKDKATTEKNWRNKDTIQIQSLGGPAHAAPTTDAASHHLQHSRG